ncbi:MAG: glycosyltransferase family 2 protein [Coriobacteriales bacterium]|jgi:glycosyltransferase involved in cell wall biosynthesis|nr:glycosyltransferase family 2 protein [Coriobacteriales bacterium]
MTSPADTDPELTILMPCLDEAETLATCIGKAQSFLKESGIVGEVLIADNGSTDGSQELAQACGARVVDVPIRGYGAALITGSREAHGTYVIMGDADDSYDFEHLQPFVDKLREGHDLVMGNRFKGGIAEGAMPPLHKYLGNPVLSFIGRLFFRSPIGDFHCGLRGYNKEAIQGLGLKTTGMEYASEMVVQATLADLKIAEVPTTLSKDGRSRPPHLRSWSDGWRHLKFLLTHAPNWLFTGPGLFFLLLGAIILIALSTGPLTIGGVAFDIHTMLYGAAFTIIGATILTFALFTNVYAAASGYIPLAKKHSFFERLAPERIIVVGLLLGALGLAATILAFALWGAVDFGDLDPSDMMRITIPSLVLMVIGVELIFAGFFVGVLKH